MKVHLINAIVLGLAASSSAHPVTQHAIKTSYDSGYHDVKTAAKVARTLVQRESMVNLNTVDYSSGFPVSFVEYYADCYNNGTPVMLMIDISSSNKNIQQGSKASLSIRVGDHQYKDRVDPHYTGGIVSSTAGSPRVNFKGKFVDIDPTLAIEVCFAKRHRESPAWYPGGPVHSSHWTKFEIEEIYMVGGFGDRAYIGNLPLDEYFNATSFDDDEEFDRLVYGNSKIDNHAYSEHRHPHHHYESSEDVQKSYFESLVSSVKSLLGTKKEDESRSRHFIERDRLLDPSRKAYLEEEFKRQKSHPVNFHRY